MQISDLKWIAVWCIQYKVLFGQLNFTKSEVLPEEEPYGESESTKEDGYEGEALLDYGKFSELKYGVSGHVYSKGNHQILDIKSFNYDGKGT